MTDKELITNWSQQQLREVPTTTMLEITKNAARRLDKAIKNRDRLEIAVGLLVSVAFTFVAIFSTGLKQVGAVLIVLYGIWVVVVLRFFRRKHPKSMHQPSIVFLNDYLEYMKSQRQLIKNVIWWYILPAFVSQLFFLLGVSSSPGSTAVAILVTVGIMVFIARINRKAVKTQFDPIIQQLQEVIASLQLPRDL